MLKRSYASAAQPPRQGQRGTWAAGGAVVVLIGALLAWAMSVRSSAARIDPVTLCEESGPSAVTAVLIDATDPISDFQHLAVTNKLTPLLRSLRPNERVDVFRISPDADPLAPVLSMCRPRTGEETDELTGSKSRAERRFTEQFKPALDRALADLLTQPPGRRSPIMESIQAASVRSLQAPDLQAESEGFRKRLIVVSDMLQFSDAGTHLDSAPEWREETKASELSKVASDLTDTEVFVLYLYRDASRSQGKRHVEYWRRWFAEQGAVVESVMPVEG